MICRPTVSIVIPTYNHAYLLRRALGSVSVQTFRDWEAIVVNNFSQDDTEEVVNQACDPRIRLVNFRNHGIIAASRNRGISLAAGNWIAFLDSDDIWYPEKLERSMAVLARGNDLVCHGEAWVRKGVRIQEVFYGPQARAQYRSLLFGSNCLSTSAVTVRKACLEAVGGFREHASYVSVEDYDLWLRLARAGYRFAFVDEILGEAHTHGGNESRHLLRSMRAELAVLGDHFSGLGRMSLTDRMLTVRRCSRVYLSHGIRFLRLR